MRKSGGGAWGGGQERRKCSLGVERVRACEKECVSEGERVHVVCVRERKRERRSLSEKVQVYLREGERESMVCVCEKESIIGEIV